MVDFIVVHSHDLISRLCAAVATHSEVAFELCKNPEYFPLLGTVNCSVDKATQIMVDFIVAFALLYFLVTYVLLLIRLKGYRKQPYTFVQVGLVYNTLQVNDIHSGL